MARRDDQTDSRWMLWESLRDWDRRYATAIDTVLGVGMFVLFSGWFLHLLSPRHDIWFVAGLTLPLLLRRRYPLGVFMVVAAVALAQWLTTGPLLADVALLVAMYTVAVDCAMAGIVAAAVLLEVGVILATVRWAPAGNNLKSLVFLTGMALAALLAGITVRELRNQLDWLAERGDRLELERDQQTSLAAAAERARIAREMHDVISHNLQVMVTLADGASVAQRSDPARAAEAMAEVSGTGRQALTDMRRMLGLLREDPATNGVGRAEAGASDGKAPGPSLAPQPGLPDLPALVKRVGATGLPVRLEMSGPPFELSEAAAVTVYRIVQEALTNALKHAVAPDQVEVRVSFADPEVTVQVTDDAPRPEVGGADASWRGGPGGGSGDGGRDGAGLGITGMRERAAAFGGTLAAGPRAQGGWQVTATLHGRKVPTGP
jgi:signal transduction histidine kinase